MSQIPEEEFVEERGVDLRKLALTVLSGWKLVAICVGIAIILAILHLHAADTIYSAQMQVTPIQSSGEDNSSKLGALGGLASLAGVNTPASQNTSQFRLYIESMHSRDVAEDLAKNQSIMLSIFGREWDSTTQSWREPTSSLLDNFENSIWSFLGFRTPTWEAPDGARLQQFLINAVQVIQDPKKTYIATVRLDTWDPKFAISFLTALNQAADNHLRQKALLRAKLYIDYLTSQLNTVTIAEHREAIMETLSEQEKFAMVANSATPFAADLFDKPSTSIEPLSPQPRQVFMTDILIGGAIGVALVFALKYFGATIREYIRSRFPVQKLPDFIRRPLQL